MRRHVVPADPAATIPDPERGRPLPAEGQIVTWSSHWAGLAQRGDVVVSDVMDEPEAQAEPADTPDEPPKPARGRGAPPPGDEPA